MSKDISEEEATAGIFYRGVIIKEPTILKMLEIMGDGDPMEGLRRFLRHVYMSYPVSDVAHEHGSVAWNPAIGKPKTVPQLFQSVFMLVMHNKRWNSDAEEWVDINDPSHAVEPRTHPFVVVNCDGGSRGNPGNAAIGVVVRDPDNNTLEEYREYLGDEITNNEAEYMGLIRAMELASKYVDNGGLRVYMDSKLVVMQCRYKWQCKSVRLRPLLKRVRELEKQFLFVRTNHVKRTNTFQQDADALVNIALDEAGK